MPEPERVTFDTEAVLAFYLGEDGGEVVKDAFLKVQDSEVEGYINIINLAEIYCILCRVDPKLAEEKERNLRLFGVKVVPIDDNGLWQEASRIKSQHPMSLADAFAAATARMRKSTLMVGSDEDFRGIGIPLTPIRRQVKK